MTPAEETRPRELDPWLNTLVRAVAVGFAVYHLYVLGFSPNDPWVHRALHLFAVTFFVFMLWPARPRRSPSNRPSILDIAWIGLAAAAAGYILYAFDDLIGRLGVLPEFADVVMATIAVVVLLEMTRRVTGLVLPVLALIFIAYALYGASLPGLLGHRGYSYERAITFLYGLEGIYGPSLAASATFVTLFVMFGAVLNRSGAGRFFVDLSYAAAGGRRGGPAKVAVLASALFGSISGSAVSNAVTTGTFTIPLMKSVGYSPSFAAAVEAVASTGGQLMPPVMSATAFVMAEVTGIPYLTIAYAALVPSILYFLAAYFIIDYEARNLGLTGVPASERPALRDVLLRQGHLLLPLVVLIYALLVMRSSPLQAALLGGLAAIVVGALRKSSRMGPRATFDALADGMLNMVPIATTCALAGIVVGIFSLTGLGLKFASALIAFSGGELWLALLLSMVVCIVLGMGMPTVAAYVVTAAAVAPGLVQLGVPVLAAHLFILYFAAISTITPPVAITVFATAGLAGAPPMRVGAQAVKLGIAAYLVPYMFVYSGSLLLQGSWLEVAVAVPTALVGVWALAKGVQDRATSWPARAVLTVAAIVLIKPGLITDSIGGGLVLAVLAAEWLRNRPAREAASDPRDTREAASTKERSS